MSDLCRVTENDVKKDAEEMSKQLLSGDLAFYQNFDSKYGAYKERECALTPFIVELSKLAPDQVKLTDHEMTPANTKLGHMSQTLAPDAKSAVKGYDMNITNLFGSVVINKLKADESKSLELMKQVNKQIDPSDRAFFVADFNKRKGNLPFNARVDQKSNDVQLVYDFDQAKANDEAMQQQLDKATVPAAPSKSGDLPARTLHSENEVPAKQYR